MESGFSSAPAGLALTVLFAGAAALAADGVAGPTRSAVSVGTVLVSATPITEGELIGRDGSQSSFVSRRQIDSLAAQDLQTALRQIPGVSISRYSPIGSYGGGQGGSVYVRGAGTSRPGGEVRIYSDGVPRESGVWGHPLMDSVPIDFAESVTVRKHPQLSRTAGAFASVELETRRRREEGFEGEMNTAYGRFSTFLSSFSGGAKEGAGDVYGGVSFKRSDGAREHSKATLSSAFARIGADLSETESAAFIYRRTDSSVEDPGRKGAAKPRFDRFDLSTDMYAVRFDTARDWIEGYSLVYVEHGSIEWRKDHLVDGNLFSPAGAADTTWLNWGTRNRYEISPNEYFSLIGSLDASSEGGHTANTRFSDGARVSGFKARFVSVMPYAGASGSIPLDGAGGDWKLEPSAGARAFMHSVYENEWGPGGALKVSWRDTLEIFANAERGIHYPGIYTRAVSDDFAKHALGAEKMDYFSSGGKVHGDDGEASLVFFHTRVADRIDRTAWGYVNVGGMESSGLEGSAHLGLFDGRASLFAGCAWTVAHTHPVSRLPEWSFSAGVSWRICERVKWNVDGEYIGSMNAYSTRSSSDSARLEKTGDAFVFNTRLSCAIDGFLPAGSEAYAAVENFTNSHYEYFPGYPMPGVMFYLGVKICIGS